MSTKCYLKLQIILQADPFTGAGLDSYCNCEVRWCSFEVKTSPTTDSTNALTDFYCVDVHKEQKQQH